VKELDLLNGITRWDFKKSKETRKMPIYFENNYPV